MNLLNCKKNKNMFGMSNDKLVKYFADKFLQKDDKSLIAFYDSKGNAKCEIYKHNVYEEIKNGRAIIKLQHEKINELKETIKKLKNGK